MSGNRRTFPKRVVAAGLMPRARLGLAAASALGVLLAVLLPARSGEVSSTPPEPAFVHYVGGLHTHTGYSDGVPGSTPGDAYVNARDAESLDFMAVTEHSEALRVPFTLSEGCLESPEAIAGCAFADPDAPADSFDKWDAQRPQAVSQTRPGDFLALRGFELTNDVFGHVNVYFSRNFVTRAETAEAAGMEAFYQWLRTPAAAGGGADGLATFNHPNDKKVLGNANVRGNNWNDFAYVPDLDERIVGIEVFNRAKNYESWVLQALDKGWHLGLVGAEDIHESNWGADVYAKTVFLAEGLTMPDLKEAMKARRMYATLDKTIRISFTAGGRPMGSRIAAFEGVPLTIHVDGGNVDHLDLLSNDAGAVDHVVASAAGRDLSFTATPASDERYYFLRVVEPGGRKVAYSSPIWVRPGLRPIGIPLPEPTTPAFPRWVAGDLHVHTTYSHDVCDTPPTPENCDPDGDGDPTEPYTWGWDPGEQIANAESRGLDFIVITDHNDTRSVYDPGYTSDRLTLVPGYENSLAGHAQMIGAISCYGPTGRVVGQIQDCNHVLNGDDRLQVQSTADALRADGGAFQINHPSDLRWRGRFGDGSSATPIVPDTVEVWNISAWVWQPPAPSSNNNDYALEFWQTYLNAGYHVTATGGSDNHWRSTFWGQGVGQPTTWVWVTEPGWRGVVEGLRAGRTFVAHQPPAFGGPRLYLEANVDGDPDYEAMVGDTAPAGATFRVRAENLLPGSVYRVVTNLGFTEISAEATTNIPAELVAGAAWVRVELRHPDAQDARKTHCDPLVGSRSTHCRNRLVVEALTSPIYVSS